MAKERRGTSSCLCVRLPCSEGFILPISDGLDPVALIPVSKGQIPTGKIFADVVLPEVEKTYITRRPKTGTRGLHILYDNTKQHKTLDVI